MNKNLTFLSLVTMFILGLMASNACYAKPMETAMPTHRVMDKPFEFREISLSFVKNPQGQYLGRISDLVFDSHGHITFAILSRPGAIGIPGRPLAVPFSALVFNDKDKVFDLNVNWEKLESAAVFSRGDLDNRKWVEDTYRYFGQQPYWTEEGYKKEKNAAMVREEAMPVTHGWSRPHEVTEILGDRVMNPQGKNLGRINDLVFDREGRVSFVVLGYGGFLRIGEKLVAIPFGALSYQENEKHLVLDITPERLDAAPVFNRKTLGDLQWADEVYRYFGQQPYWTEPKK